MRRPCLQNHWVSLTIGFDTFYRSFNYGRSVYKKHLAMLKELLKDYQGYQQFDEQNCEKAHPIGTHHKFETIYQVTMYISTFT